MPEVTARLAEIDALITAESPFDRLTGTVYVDAQAAIQWFRLNVFEDIMDLLSIGDHHLPRFRMQDAAFNEVVGVLSKRFHLGAFGEIKSYVRRQANLLIDGPLEATAPVGKRALALRQQMCIQAGEDPSKNVKNHLGEAESLAMIEHHEPGSIFVTADKGAIIVARSSGIAHIVRPSAFTAGAMRTRDNVIEMWKHTCFARLCVFDDAWNRDCVEALECASLTPKAAGRSPVSSEILNAAEALSWMRNDLNGLITVLQAKGD